MIRVIDQPKAAAVSDDELQEVDEEYEERPEEHIDAEAEREGVVDEIIHSLQVTFSV